MKKIFTVLMCVLLIAAMSVTAFAEGNEPAAAAGAVLDAVIVNVIEITGTLLKTGLGLLMAWAVAQLGRTEHTKGLAEAMKRCDEVVAQTVDELQEDLVNGMKAARADGKLTETDVDYIKKELIATVCAKLPNPMIKLLEAGKADLNAYIIGQSKKILAEKGK